LNGALAHALKTELTAEDTERLAAFAANLPDEAAVQEATNGR
jgi:hypothetical protein